MTFPLTPSSPFTAFVTAIPSATLNAWRVAINEALDGTGGGTYTPSNPLNIIGAGAYIDPLSAWVRNGYFLNIDNGGNFATIPGATVLLEAVTQQSGLFESTGGGIVSTSPWAFTTNLKVVQESAGSVPFIGIGDQSLGPGQLYVDGRSSGAGSFMSFLGNAAAIWNTGTSLTTVAGSTSTFGGTVALEGTTTQTGAYIKSGFGGWTQERVGSVTTPNTTTTVDPTRYDVVWLDSSTGGGSNTNTTINLAAAPSFSCRCRFVCLSGSSSGTYSVGGVQLGPGTGGGAAFQQVAWAEFMSLNNPDGTGGWKWWLIGFSNAGV